ncbi:uncharacterized protein [Watersipora subatra]|uniref:uncharacterized protein n=1 Tax=Watersipora subatra TaxID=2589382 RepID=UPI00355BD92D
MNHPEMDSDRNYILNPKYFDIHLTSTWHVQRPTTDALSPSTNNAFTKTVYVEWYWVILGLIIPILLGSLFCILDHLRRKKPSSSRQTEQRLESMCERNKYVPPKYEEIISNNHIIIPPIREVGLPPSPEMHQQVFTIEAEESAVHSIPDYKPAVAGPPLTLDNCSIDDTLNLTSDSCKPTVISNNCDTEKLGEPPSYEHYHQYELYGSRAELV